MFFSLKGTVNPPLPENETQRLEVLHETRLLDSEPEKVFDDLTALAAKLCQTPIALISLVDETRQFFKSAYGIWSSERETPRSLSFCAHALASQEPMIVEDASLDQRFCRNPLVTEFPHLGFYAGIPLVLDDMLVLGTLCVLDYRPWVLDEEQLDLLRLLARQITSEIRLRIQLRRREREEERYRLMFEENPQPMLVATVGGEKVLASNEAASELYGYSSDEFLELTLEKLSTSAPDSLRTESSELGQPEQIERHTKKDGGTLLVFRKERELEFKNRACRLVLITDVSERYAAESRLQERNGLLSDAQKMGQLGSWHVDLRVGRLTWSESTCSIFGISPEHFEGRVEDFLSYVLPEDLHTIKTAMDRVEQASEVIDLKYRIRRPDGEVRWLYERGKAELATDGTVVARLGMVMDITEEQRKAEALAQAVALQKIAGQTARLGGWQLQHPSRQLEISDELAALWPISPPFDLDKLSSLFQAADQPRLAESIQRCLQSGESFDVELLVETHAEPPRHARVIGQAHYGPSGEISGLQGAMQDITALRQAERSVVASNARFRQFADSSPHMVWTAGPDGQVDYVNHHFFAFTGVGQETDAATRWQNTLHPDDLPECLTRWKRAVEAQSHFEMEYRIRRYDGVHRWCQVQATPIRDQDGILLMWSGTAIDIDEIKQLQTEASRLAQRFTKTLESLSEGFLTINSNFEFTYLNTAAEQLLQRNRESLLGRNIWEAFPETLGGQFQKQFEKSMRERCLVAFEDFYPGLSKWFEVQAHPSEGGLVVHLRDITEQHFSREVARQIEHDVFLRSNQLEDANDRLAQSSALLQMALRVSRMGAWWYDFKPEPRLSWSPELKAVMEVPPSYQPDYEEEFGRYVPEHQEKARLALENCITHGRSFNLELQLYTGEQKKMWARFMGEAVRDEHDSIVRIQGAYQDISEHKIAEQEVRNLARRLRGTLESIGDGFYTIDEDWRFTYFNGEAERLYGRPREEVLGRSLWQEFPITLGSQVETEFRRARTTNAVVGFEYFYEPFATWFDIRAYPNEDGLAVFFRDVTVRRQNSEQLRLLQSSVERLRDIVMISGAQQSPGELPRLIYVNEAVELLTGYTPSELVGKTPAVLNWAESQPDVLERILQALTTWKPINEQLRCLTKGGQEIWLELDMIPVAGEDDRLSHWIAINRDVTERKYAEERLRENAALIDMAQDAIVVRDLQHRVTFWNKSSEDLYGYTAEEVQGKAVTELLYRNTDAFVQAYQTTLETGEWRGELEQMNREGKMLIVESRWSLVRHPDGEPKAILAINSDHTERRKLEKQFLRAQRMESIGTLAGGIAHDLNNLLSPILMGVDLLQHLASDPRAKSILESMSRSANRGAELVRQVLSFARGVEGHRVGLNLKHTVREIENIISNTFPKNIDFALRMPNDLWQVMGDPTQLHQVLLNLCVNARDAMPNGGSLVIRIQNTELDKDSDALIEGAQPGRFVLMEVSDDGEGMARDVIDRVFEPFFTTKEMGKGSGLGLSTVIGIVRSHGGFIHVSSEVGRGSVFQVFLPAHTESSQGDSPQKVAGSLPRGTGQCILVVDDETTILSISRQILETFGYRVITAENGVQATKLYAAHQNEVDLVLTDMMMPVMDGPDLIRQLQEINPNVKIITASGLNNPSESSKENLPTSFPFLAKPFSAKQLLTLVQQVMSS